MSYDDNRRPSKRTFHLLKHMRKDDTAPPSSSTYTSQLHQEQQQTPNSRRCYTCKRPKCNPSTDDPMCTTCRSLNETMKTSKADLSGRYAVVTGARIKIGYEVAVRLRRDGCHVVATTR
jgi:3-oxoacyl-ACP reductase-like protein